jgi:hypothetical protein
MDQHFPLPDGSGDWIVRAYRYPTIDEARAKWKELEDKYVNDEGNHSAWATTTPDYSLSLLVVCGYEKHLPEIEGELYPLSYEEARSFALRRAKFGMDAFEKYGPDAHVSSRRRYGEKPVTITESGDVVPWYQN